MKMRLRRKSQEQSAATITSAPAQFQSRPLVQASDSSSSSITANEASLPNLQQQLEPSPHLGYNFGQIQIQSATPRVIQPKLTIGAPNDQYEQEADQVAQQVVQQINAPAQTTSAQGQPIQRLAMPEDEDKLATKPLADGIQRLAMPEDEDKLATKPLADGIQRLAMPKQEDKLATLESTINQSKSSGKPLEKPIRRQMEGAFGANFSNVRIHTDSTADRLNRSINARAFTTGNHIFFKQGEYNSTKDLLPHELTHVVQQGGASIQRQPESVAPTSHVDLPMVQMDPDSDEKAPTLTDEEYTKYTDIVGKLFEKKTWQKNGKTKEGSEYQKRDKVDYGLLKDDELEAIEKLSQTEKGRKYIGQLKSSSKATSRKEFQHGLDQASGENTANYYKFLAMLLDKNNNSRLTGSWLATGSNVSSLEFWSKRKLTSMERLLIATYQAKLGQENAKYRKTPGYLRYEAQQAKQGSEEHKETIYKKDTDAWEKLLNINDGNKQEYEDKLVAKGININEARASVQKSIAIANIMRRVFTVLQYNLEYSNDKNDKGENQTEKPMGARDWHTWTKQVAVALSHGGRVNITLPALGNQYNEKNKNDAYYQERDRFVNWIYGVKPGQKANERRSQDLANTDYKNANVETRPVSTHDVEITEDSFEEKKVSGLTHGFGHWSKGKSEEHYGINPALGGLGETDLAGNVILPDGCHGHIYIFYKPATPETKGAVLIGGETSEMGKRDVFGKLHNASGTSAEFSPTGTGKSARIGSEIGGMRVDLAKDFANQDEIVKFFAEEMKKKIDPKTLVGMPDVYQS